MNGDADLKEFIKLHPIWFDGIPDNIKDKLINLYPSYPLKEAFFLYKRDLKERPKCPICNEEIILKGQSYSKTCSKKCAIELRKRTNMIEYGGVAPACNKTVQEKMKATNAERYGVESAGNRPEGRNKAKETWLNKYGVDNPNKLDITKEKIKNTCLKRYGVENPNQSKRARKSCLEKFGVENRNLIRKDPDKVLIWKNKDKLEEFIKNSNTPYYEDLAEQLDLTSYGLNVIVHNFNLQHLIKSRTSTSKNEKEIVDYIKSIYDGEIRENIREIISPYELDIYLPEKQIAIEYNGDYWHNSNKQKDNKYHQKKSLLCREKNIQLIHIFEYEWNDESKRNKIKSYLKDILNKDVVTVYARDCVVKEVSFKDTADFLNKYHLQGSDRAPIRYGLYYKEELMSLMTFSKPRFNKNYEWELSRFVTKFGYRVTGGASKLLKHFERKYKPLNIISYCNLSKMKGNVYNKIGFYEINISEPNYVWVKGNDIKSRYQCQSHNLRKQGFEGTEVEIMESLNYYRIFDSGNVVYRKDFFKKLINITKVI